MGNAVGGGSGGLGPVALTGPAVTGDTIEATSATAAIWTAGGGGPPTGAAGGDLGGTYPDPSVVSSGGFNIESAAFQPATAFDLAGAAAAAAAASLPLTGGTMSGPIAMGANKVTGLVNGSGAQDAAAFGQLPTLASLGAAPLASPALTGSPTAPTQTAGDSSTLIATDAFVAAAVTAGEITAGTGLTKTGNTLALSSPVSLANLGAPVLAYANAAGQSGGMTGQGYAGATASFQNAPVTAVPAWTSGFLYGVWVFCVPGAAVNGFVSVLPWVTGALANTFIAVYNSAGVQLGITADLSATGTNGRGIRVALTGFTAVPADGKIFAVYTNGTGVAGSGPGRMNGQIAAQGSPNSGVSALMVSGAEYQTATTMPASLTYGASGIPSAPGAWNGASTAFPLLGLD